MCPLTIRDVAQQAGVGIGTVSRVLNGSEQVSEETRERVLAVIRELGFSPNTAARQLSGGKTSTIGVVTAFFTFPSFVERLGGVQSVLNESDYDLVLYSIQSLDQLERRMQVLTSQNRVDGLIVLSLPFDEALSRQASPNLPIVIVDGSTSGHRYPHVVIDNVAGGVLATTHLIARGHRQLGFVGDWRDNPLGFTSTINRHRGFEQALREHDLPLREDWCLFVEHSEHHARQAALRLLRQPVRPTAIFAAIDTLAFGVLQAAEDLGLRVPDDLAVIGFDDIHAARFVRLTTVRQGLRTSGEIGARLMLEWLATGGIPDEDWQIVLPLEIVERATT